MQHPLCALRKEDAEHSYTLAVAPQSVLLGSHQKLGKQSRHCPVTANPIASQLVKNRVQKTGYRESNRVVVKVSDLWKIPKPDDIS